MSNARTMSGAGLQLAREGGARRVDGLVAELRDRSDELGPRQVAPLQDVLVKAAGLTSTPRDQS
jgi:hypothetical protein